MSLPLLTLIITTTQAVLLTVFLIGRWVGHQEQQKNQQDHTPPPLNMDIVTRHEEELKRCRDRLHNLEGRDQSLMFRIEERHPTRREFEGLERRINVADRRLANE